MPRIRDKRKFKPRRHCRAASPACWAYASMHPAHVRMKGNTYIFGCHFPELAPSGSHAVRQAKYMQFDKLHVMTIRFPHAAVQ
jgi:hypothetical protein